MHSFYKYFLSFKDTVEENAFAIIVALVGINLFVKFGLGFLFALGLVAFAGHAIYDRFKK